MTGPAWGAALLSGTSAALVVHLLTAPPSIRRLTVASPRLRPAPARWARTRALASRLAGSALPRRGRAAAARAALVVQFAEALAAELRAGSPAPRALAVAARSVPDDTLPPQLADTALLGGPVAALLEQAARAPGAAGLTAVAACWSVSQESGAAMALGLADVVRTLRAEQSEAREVSAQLAAPRATGRLLAVLPLFGLLLGSSLGANPLQVLLTSPVGWACLAVGIPLQIVGWWWVERLAASADPWLR